MSGNPVAAFADAMRAAGIEPPAIIKGDGRLHRFPTNGERHDDAGWYVLHLDGIPAGAFGDWRTGASHTWCARSADSLTPAERDAIRARIEKDQAEAAAARASERDRAAKRSAEIWTKAMPARADHPYLARKRVKPTPTLRELPAAAVNSLAGYAPAVKGEALAGRVLVAPVVIDGKLASLEMIDDAGRKAFLASGATKGGYWATEKLPEGDGEGSMIPIAEGVATAISASEAMGCVAVAALSAGNMPAAARALRGRFPKARLVMLADLDKNGVGLAKATEAARVVGGFVAMPDFGAARPEGAADFNDMAALRGLEAVHAAIEAAKEPKAETSTPLNGESVDDDAEIARLAKLPSIQYDREREAVAGRLGCRVGTLDAAVKAARGDAGDAAGQGRPLELPEPEPWPKPVDGAALLSSLAVGIKRYVILSDVQVDAVALWSIHTHAHDASDVSPKLVLKSAQKRCGKSRLAEVLERITARPLYTSGIKPAALLRIIERYAPTLLLDEIDSAMKQDKEMAEALRGLINSGFTRAGARVVMNVPTSDSGYEPRAFSTWAPILLAGIGDVPDTVRDRSIEIEMKRKRPSEKVPRLRRMAGGELRELCRMSARWAQDNMEKLRRTDPEIPDGLNDRAADAWEPLFTIADLAGGGWGKRARMAALALSGDAVHEDDSVGVMVLDNIRVIFGERKLPALPSEELAATLGRMEDRPWSEWKARKPITPRQLAKLLHPFGIHPGTIRLNDGTTPKGYKLEAFADAFARYLPSPGILSATTPQPAETLGFPGFFDPPQKGGVADHKMASNPRDSATCGGVADENRGEGENAHDKADLPWGNEL